MAKQKSSVRKPSLTSRVIEDLDVLSKLNLTGVGDIVRGQSYLVDLVYWYDVNHPVPVAVEEELVVAPEAVDELGVETAPVESVE